MGCRIPKFHAGDKQASVSIHVDFVHEVRNRWFLCSLCSGPMVLGTCGSMFLELSLYRENGVFGLGISECRMR